MSFPPLSNVFHALPALGIYTTGYIRFCKNFQVEIASDTATGPPLLLWQARSENWVEFPRLPAWRPIQVCVTLTRNKTFSVSALFSNQELQMKWVHSPLLTLLAPFKEAAEAPFPDTHRHFVFPRMRSKLGERREEKRRRVSGLMPVARLSR